MIAAVIVAAGEGRRLGGVAKALLASPGGSTFLASICEVARAAGVGSIVVVVGGTHAEATAREAERQGVATAVNRDPRRGMASSVAVGFAHALAHFGVARAALLWPVDHAAVRAETVAGLAERAEAGRVVIPTFGGRGGHPALVGRALWPQLARCAATPGGARGVFRARPERVVRVPVEDAGVIADVDTPGDRP